MRDSFNAGEVLVYQGEAWSHYDGVTGYFFHAPGDVLVRSWDIDDSDDLAVWRDLFEEA